MLSNVESVSSITNRLLGMSSLANPVRMYTISDLKPVSLNHAYATRQGRGDPASKQPWKNKLWRRKTAEAEMYQFLIREHLGYIDHFLYESKIESPNPTKGIGYSMQIVFFVPSKNLRIQDHSKFKRFDGSNCIKLIEDAVFEYLGLDDACNLDVSAYKRLSWDDRWHFTILLSMTHIQAYGYSSFSNPLWHDLRSASETPRPVV